ncbi:MAG: DMT family transporter, partial [Planctomycetes bacterium]|nr:DMT family transporter [Planctomycetota bacterium]
PNIERHSGIDAHCSCQVQPPARPIDPVLLLVVCIWGAGNVVTKWVLGVLDPPAFLALRMAVVSTLMAAMLLLGPRTRFALRDWLMVSVCGGGLMAAQFLSFSYAMKLTTASEGSLLVSTAPVWTAVIVAVLGVEHVTRLNWLGIVVASGGVAMIVLGPSGKMFSNAPSRLSGDLLMLGSAWLYAGYMVFSRHWMQRIGELPVICSTFAAAGVLLVVVGARPLLASDWSTVTAGHWVGIAYVALMAGFVGLILWYRTIGRTSASGTAVYQYLVPGVSIVAAAIFLGERIVALQLAGIAVTLVGVYLARVPADPALARR